MIYSNAETLQKHSIGCGHQKAIHIMVETNIHFTDKRNAICG